MTTAVELHLVAAERLLVERLLLRRVPDVPPRLANARGLWKDAPVTIATRTYQGDAIAYARVAMVTGVQLAIASLLVQPRPNRPLPILLATLTWRGEHRDSAVRASLAPMSSETHTYLPELTPLDAEVPRERLPEALSAFDAYVRAFLTQCGSAADSATADPDAIRARQHAFLEAQRTDPDTQRLLSTMFGHAWGEEYLRVVLFPGD